MRVACYRFPGQKEPVPGFLRKLESDPDGPDIPDSERGFLIDEVSLVPGFVADGGCRFHGLFSSVRKYKHGAGKGRALSAMSSRLE